MDFLKSFKKPLFSIDRQHFNARALELFRYQAKYNPVYNRYINFLKVDIEQIDNLLRIPFMPIEFFKYHKIQTGAWMPEHFFESSGTSGTDTSKHYIKDVAFYRELGQRIFTDFYGPLEKFRFMALLPSYLDNPHSSLIEMIRGFMQQSSDQKPLFYGSNYQAFLDDYKVFSGKNRIVVFGVPFALLDLSEKFNDIHFDDTILIETGGMKGRREEITREELHEKLESAFKLGNIHSEYGMCEIMSQFYAISKGRFKGPAWTRVLVREVNDPRNVGIYGRSGGINIIDLGNVHSCAFIETKDIGIAHEDGTFEVMGRFDNSDVRGCSLLMD